MILLCKTEMRSMTRLSQACSCCLVANPEQMDILFILIISSIQNPSIIYQSQQLTMIYQQSSWRPCLEHQQEIAILQEKLKQIHHKLLTQLEICREQELTIFDLNAKITQIQSNQHRNFDTFHQQSFGMQSLSSTSKENQDYYHKNHGKSDSQDSHKNKVMILQADLEAMRSKVLEEITQKSRLKEELNEMKAVFKKQARKVEKLENGMQKLRQQNQGLKQRCQNIRRKGNRPETQVNNLLNTLAQVQSLYGKQKRINRQLISQNQQLAGKIYDLQHQLYQQRYETAQKKKHYYEDEYRSKQKETKKDRSLGKIRKERVKNEQKQNRYRRQASQKAQQKDKRKSEFEETRQLIKKLQEAQASIRRNRKQV